MSLQSSSKNQVSAASDWIWDSSGGRAERKVVYQRNCTGSGSVFNQASRLLLLGLKQAKTNHFLYIKKVFGLPVNLVAPRRRQIRHMAEAAGGIKLPEGSPGLLRS